MFSLYSYFSNGKIIKIKMGVTKNEMPIGEALHFLKHCPSFRQNYSY
jgi:hypothetical protein